MFEKVNPSHPDKVADRIAGAFVDLCYTKDDKPKAAVEVLLGHGKAAIIAECSVFIDFDEADAIVKRIAGDGIDTNFLLVPQDSILSQNQQGAIRCGDNGIFKGMPVSVEEKRLANIARGIYAKHPSDGKYIIDGGKLIVCQSNATREELHSEICGYAIINPLGDWTGGTNVDCGATNRKLGSDMGRAVTGGGLHGKDLSKADVSVNIYAHIKAQETGKPWEACCAIGDEFVNGIRYEGIVEKAREYIESIGGFEKFAEWGLI